jgi:hypothetical protein
MDKAIATRLAESQQRLAYLEDQIRLHKKLMVIVTFLAGMTVLLNRCG